MNDTVLDRITPRPQAQARQPSAVASVPREHVLAVNLASVGAQLAGLSEQERRLLRLFDGRRTVADVIDDSLLGDGRCLSLIASLLQARVLEVATARALSLLDGAMPDPTAVRFDELGNELPPPPTEADDAALLASIARAKRARLVAGLVLLAVAVTGLWLGFGSSETLVAPPPETLATALIVTPPPEPPVAAPAVAEPVAQLAAIVEPPAPAVSAEHQAALGHAKTLYDSGRLQEAVAVLEQVVAQAPGAVDGWVLLGLARFDARDGAGARAAGEKVLALDPHNARVQLLFASLALEAHDKAGAALALGKYLELEPHGADAAEAAALLERASR